MTLRDEFAAVFLARLRRLVWLQSAWRPEHGHRVLDLLHHAIYSTYFDLRELGCESEARRAIGRMREAAL